MWRSRNKQKLNFDFDHRHIGCSLQGAQCTQCAVPRKHLHTKTSFLRTDNIKGLFPLRACKRLFFVCFIDFFALLSARFNFKRGKINRRNKERSFPRS